MCDGLAEGVLISEEEGNEANREYSCLLCDRAVESGPQSVAEIEQDRPETVSQQSVRYIRSSSRIVQLPV